MVGRPDRGGALRYRLRSPLRWLWVLVSAVGLVAFASVARSPWPLLAIPLAAALLLGGMYVTPLWRIELIAPQYPEGLGMLIRLNTVSGIQPNDLDNINMLNHYIGMKPITPEAIPELRIMPWVVGGLIVFYLNATLNFRSV